MRYIVRACNERNDYVDEILKILPSAEIAWDTKRNAMDTFISALALARSDEVVHIEDDAILHTDFVCKSSDFISSHDGVVQFFSMRKADLEIGTRKERGAKFLASLCFYLPRRYSKLLLEFSETWKRIDEHPTGFDLMVADFLKSRREHYWICIPNLADHRQCKSLIDSRRSKYRQSLTFERRTK